MAKVIQLDVRTGEVREFDDPSIEEEPLPVRLERAKQEIRIRRDALLRESDWTQLPDAPLTPEQVAEWRSYRNSLRNILKTHTDDEILSGSINWPVPPEWREK